MADDKSPAQSIGGKILKSIGVITAIISIVLGTRQIVNIIQDNAARKNKAAELKAGALQLASSGLYSKAWETMSQAVEVDPDFREAQVELAMEWLREARTSPSQKERTFTEIVDKLVPVLHRALDTTRKQYSATVRAHIGWATFLLFKDGNRSVRVDDHFRNALQMDSINLYAHAMYGFWMLYPGHDGGSIEDANRHFVIALRNVQEKKYVRDLMFFAFRNMQRPEYQAQILKLVNEIRKNHETMERSQREKIVIEAYYMYRDEIMEEVGKVMTAKDHLETFTYLTQDIDVNARPYLNVALAKLRKVAATE